ncbi:hybrid sensor histidine kinase/response regulator [Bacteroidia bacterium]|nr:hybrid sensor histidine kinase/response regulator [Bacteroidia bacterium]
MTTISYLFTVKSGLSSSKVTCILQDSKGFFWIGTEDGLSKFDGYNFTVYKTQQADSLSLISNHITALYQDSNERLWVATIAGLEYYDYDYEGFVNVSLNQLGSAYIRSMVNDKEGHIWMALQNKGISVYDPKTNTFQNYNTSNSQLPSNTVFDIRQLKNGNMMICTLKEGVSIFDVHTHAFMTYTDVFNSPSTRSVVTAVEDSKGSILVGTEGNGVFEFDPLKRELKRYPLLEEFSNELDDANVSSLYIGFHDYVWVGLKYKGVFVAGNEQSGFRTIRKINYNPNSLNYNYVTGVTRDNEKNLWIATDGGGLNHYNVQSRQFTHYTNRKDNPLSISDNAVLSVFCDSRNRIWAGTHIGGLCLFNRDKETFTRFMAPEGAPSGLQSDYIKSIQEDKHGALWLGTNGGGLTRLDPESETFRTYNSEDHKGLINDYIIVLYADSKNRLWIGTYFGLSCMDIDTESFIAYKDDSGLSNLSVFSIGESPDGSIWVGTTNGLNKFNPETNNFSLVYPAVSTNSTAVINGIIPNDNQLWLSTNKGIVRYDTDRKTAKLFNESNSGIDGDEFLPGSYYKSTEGEIFFGGTKGLTAFYPGEIGDSVTIQKVYITGLKISNEPVLINKPLNGRVILTRNIAATKKISLRYNEKNFTLNFVAMGSYKPYSTVYACKLEGFDDQWSIYDYTQRSVTYTNLSPGSYTLQIKASSDPAVWGDEATTLIIEVEPAIWNTWWARGIYLLMALGIVYLVVRIIMNRIHDKNELKIERMNVKQQEEINRIRTNFFTNISHEFRTPLTLIIGPLKRLIGEDEKEERKQAGMLILRNAGRLQHLINQILDLNKMEEGKMFLHVQSLELVSYVSHVLEMFTELTRQKNISLIYTWSPDVIEVWYDKDMLEKCLNNLLFNALKFTSESGKIEVNVKQTDEGTVLLTIRDTGIGMDKETLEHVFDRFYQGPNQSYSIGTGIGLHLTQSIIQLHKGSISVESEEGKGSTFTMTILPGNEHFKPEEIAPTEEPPRNEEEVFMEELKQMTVKASKNVKPADGEQPTLLLIEDNSDMRLYIKQEMADDYQIEEAADGSTGLLKAQKLMPDLILLDIMMPGMSGLDLCRTLKTDLETSHIPIVILTAQEDFEHQMEGVESGADSYITKPFNTKFLRATIDNLIEIRRRMKDRFSKSIQMDAQEVTLTSTDERLLQRTIDYIRANIENPELSVEIMSRDLGLSRTHLHRKLKALTGQSPVEFIKLIRMKQAAYLLDTGKLTVSEVGYLVGYNTPSYFSTCFTAHFGMSPSAYMERDKSTEG